MLKNRPCKNGTLVKFPLTDLHECHGYVVGWATHRGLVMLNINYKGMLLEIQATYCEEVRV